MLDGSQTSDNLQDDTLESNTEDESVHGIPENAMRIENHRQTAMSA